MVRVHIEQLGQQKKSEEKRGKETATAKVEGEEDPPSKDSH